MSFRCKKHYSGWDIVQIVAGSSYPLSASIPGGLFQNRNYVPGSADSGKVPAKIFTIAVGTFYNRRRYRMGLTATIIENWKFLGWFYRVLSGIGTIAGRNLISFLLAIYVSKNPQKEGVQCFANFFIAVVGNEIFVFDVWFFLTKIFINIQCTEYDYHIFVEFSL